MPDVVRAPHAGVLWIGILSVLTPALHADEYRGMWVTRFEWPKSTEAATKTYIDGVMSDLAAANFNAVFFQVRGQADTLYPSPFEPWSPIIAPDGVDPGYDPLAYAINAAHANGIEFHAYVNTHVAWTQSAIHTPPAGHVFWDHLNAADSAAQDWLIHNNSGGSDAAVGTPVQYDESSYAWMAPGVPAMQAYVRKQIMYLATHYDGSSPDRPAIDGIHLDRIRTPSNNSSLRQWSHDPISVARFNGEGNPDQLGFYDWTSDQVNRFVRDLYAQLFEVRPDIKLSAAPLGLGAPSWYSSYGGYPSTACGFQYGRSCVAQNAEAWLSAGAMDFIVPQIYWADGGSKPDYTQLMNEWVARRHGRHIVGGQAAYKAEMTLAEMTSQVNNTRALGGHGTVPFSYSSFNFFNEYVAPGGPFETPEAVPGTPWKSGPNGLVLGTVTTDGVTPVVDAWVTSSGGPAYIALTSADGLYSLLEMPPGTHSLVVIKSGIQIFVPVSVVAGQATRVDVQFPDCAFPIDPIADCNGNGISDLCDVDPADPDGNGTVSPDCNMDDVPDECQSTLSAEFRLVNRLDLADSNLFAQPVFGGSSTNGHHPSAVASDGQSLWLAGFNNTGSTHCGIVRIDNPWSAPTVTQLISLPTPVFRGFTGLSYDPTDQVVLAAYDNGEENGTGLTAWDVGSNQLLWSKSARGFSGVAYDPGYQGMGRGAAWTTISSGRRALQHHTNGSDLYSLGTGMAFWDGGSTLWRDIDFAPNGDLWLRRFSNIARARRTGANSLDPVMDVTANPYSGYLVGQNLAYLDDAEGMDLVIYNDRGTNVPGSPFSGSIRLATTSGTGVAIRWKDTDGSDLPAGFAASRTGFFDFDWDGAAQELIIADFTNCAVYRFSRESIVGGDCNGNGVPDDCETDCNRNGIPDDCDIDAADPDGDGTVSADCNANLVPDECEMGDCSLACLPFAESFEAYPAGSEAVFRKPNFSGSTNVHLQPAPAPNVAQVSDAFASLGTQSYQFAWEFLDTGSDRWLRATTFNAPGKPNPTIRLDEPILVRLRHTGAPLRVSLGIRETGTTAEPGANGGTTGTIEWVGATGAISGAPQGKPLYPRTDVFQRLIFDPLSDPILPFTGDGVLSSPSGKGVLEHLAFSSTGGGTAFDVYIDEVRTACPEDMQPGDFDYDRDVDQDDVAIFAACASGPAVPLEPGCEEMDFDGDGDADQTDFAAIQGCFSGGDIAADPFCWP